MKLFATSRSHFSRKVRLLLDHLGTPYELVNIGNVADSDLTQFAGNPLLSVPVLEDGESWLIDSDNIAGYIVRTYDPEDRYGVNTQEAALLNARVILNGAMAKEVSLILAARTGLDPEAHAFFQKAKAALGNALAWLEDNSALFNPRDPHYADFHFISMWSHLDIYGLIDLDYPGLAKIAAALAENEIVQRSAPPAF
ncbi:glutathione S-transferase family protein [Hyphococcus luteus]|uniref:GST N-terminal domain-containing protein n=1 Tax=Hyphococcus luteus TaxID=2058213 RepID=A0A2S7K2Q4_9PROT|nr:glutathione S-transferase family protein [Marinicaulis flavus]PQA86773.1 hypothetical protein CW354_14885 [Marinicaulis flavus]